MNSNNRELTEDNPASEIPPPKQLLALLQEKASILILGHMNPDGDAVAGCIAMGLVAKHLGNQATVLLPGDLPDWAQHVPASEMIADTAPEDYDAVIAVDCADPDRLGDLKPLLESGVPCAEIDHHRGEWRLCDTVYADPDASAAGVLVYRITRALEIPLDPDLATCLYWAIATDTGFFSFSNTTPEALQICAEAVRAGARPQTIARVVNSNSLSHQRLKGRALMRLEQHLGGQVLLAAVTPEDFEIAGAVRADTEGIVDEITTVPGPAIYALFKSVHGPNTWEVSLRSNSLDCTAIAAHFDGGGHAQASGYPFSGPLEQGRRLLVEAVAEALDDD